MTHRRLRSTARCRLSWFRGSTVYRCCWFRCGFRITRVALRLFSRSTIRTRFISGVSRGGCLWGFALWRLSFCLPGECPARPRWNRPFPAGLNAWTCQGNDRRISHTLQALNTLSRRIRLHFADSLLSLFIRPCWHSCSTALWDLISCDYPLANRLFQVIWILTFSFFRSKSSGLSFNQ